MVQAFMGATIPNTKNSINNEALENEDPNDSNNKGTAEIKKAKGKTVRFKSVSKNMQKTIKLFLSKGQN